MGKSRFGKVSVVAAIVGALSIVGMVSPAAAAPSEMPNAVAASSSADTVSDLHLKPISAPAPDIQVAASDAAINENGTIDLVISINCPKGVGMTLSPLVVSQKISDRHINAGLAYGVSAPCTGQWHEVPVTMWPQGTPFQPGNAEATARIEYHSGSGGGAISFFTPIEIR